MKDQQLASLIQRQQDLISAIQSISAGLQDQSGNLTTQFTAISNALTTLEGQIQAQAAAYQTQFTAISGALTKLATNINALQASVMSLNPPVPLVVTP